MYFAVI
jgi:ABC-type multidrug transport system fused ATPase/permease subunit